jgi:hypothetical protein
MFGIADPLAGWRGDVSPRIEDLWYLSIVTDKVGVSY